MNKAVFLDKDGVINKDPGFVHKMEDFELYDGTVEALQMLAVSDYIIIIVSNAPVVGRGMCSKEEFMEFHDQYTSFLKKQGARIDDAFYCFHHPVHGVGDYKKECECRKPAPGMLEEAITKHDIDVASSYMVGDKRSDVGAGQAVGCKTILVETGCGGKGGDGCDIEPDHITADLLSAAKTILT